MTTLFSDGLHQAQALLYYPYEQIAFNLPVMCFNSPAAGERFALKSKQKNAVAIKVEDSFTSMAGQLIKLQIDYDFINDEKLAECNIITGPEQASPTDILTSSVCCENRIITPNGEMPNMIIFPDINFVCAQTAQYCVTAGRICFNIRLDACSTKILLSR